MTTSVCLNGISAPGRVVWSGRASARCESSDYDSLVVFMTAVLLTEAAVVVNIQKTVEERKATVKHMMRLAATSIATEMVTAAGGDCASIVEQ